jgi:hypothetical protein
MKTELFTVSKIFNETLFRIPDYQRGYSWEIIQLKDFWSDLEQLAEGKSHYTGVLTLETVPAEIWSRWDDDVWIIRSRRYTPYYVVDGQQRLTTVTILLQCILEAAKGTDLNYTSIESVRKKYIFDQRSGSQSRAYIFGYEKDNPSYEFLKTEIFREQSDHHSVGEATIYTRNLKNAKTFFEEKLKPLSQDELELLFTKLTQQLVFNVYEISKEIDVFVAFETMNNRGKPLSALELLKNRLIYLAMQMPEEEVGDGANLRRVINDAWKTVYHNLGKNPKRPLTDDEFLRTHFAIYYQVAISADVPSDPDLLNRFVSRSIAVADSPASFLLGRLFTRRRTQAENKEFPDLNSTFLHVYSQNLKRAVEVYFKLSTPEANGYPDAERTALERLIRLRGYEASPILLAVYLFEKASAARLAFVEAYERYHFLISLKLGPRRAAHATRYVHEEVIKYIKNKATTVDLTNFYRNSFDQMIQEESIADTLEDWLKNGYGYYGWAGVNYFLYEYELSLKNKSKTNRDKIDWDSFFKEDYTSDYSSIEHIYPQKARSPYWSDRFSQFTPAQRRLLRNSLGNLLALSRPKNSSLGNKSFPEKIGREEDTVGYRYGSYSENEVATYAEWGPQEILDRGLKMLTFLESRWQISIGDRAQKIKALGLSFLAKPDVTGGAASNQKSVKRARP